MARTVPSKHAKVYGRRPRGAAKKARSGVVPAKHKRRSWLQTPGEHGRASAQRRFEEPMADRPTYGKAP